MFKIITKNKIIKIHNMFDKLNYKINNNLSYNEFIRQAINTINHIDNFDDIKNLLIMINYCKKNWKLIERVFIKYNDEWNELQYSNDINNYTQNNNSYLFVSFFNINCRNIFYTKNNLDNSLYIHYKNKKYYVSKKYYLKIKSSSSIKAQIFDLNNNLVCEMEYLGISGFRLKKNNSKYAIRCVHDYKIDIYYKEYINSIGKNGIPNKDMKFGLIEWYSRHKLGYSRLTIKDGILDYEFLSLLSISTFILKRIYRKCNLLESTFEML